MTDLAVSDLSTGLFYSMMSFHSCHQGTATTAQRPQLNYWKQLNFSLQKVVASVKSELLYPMNY